MNYLCLNRGGQTVLVVVPEKVQKLCVGDFCRIEINRNDLGMVTPDDDSKQLSYSVTTQFIVTYILR